MNSRLLKLDLTPLELVCPTFSLPWSGRCTNPQLGGAMRSPLDRRPVGTHFRHHAHVSSPSLLAPILLGFAFTVIITAPGTAPVTMQPPNNRLRARALGAGCPAQGS